MCKLDRVVRIVGVYPPFLSWIHCLNLRDNYTICFPLFQVVGLTICHEKADTILAIVSIDKRIVHIVVTIWPVWYYLRLLQLHWKNKEKDRYRITESYLFASNWPFRLLSQMVDAPSSFFISSSCSSIAFSTRWGSIPMYRCVTATELTWRDRTTEAHVTFSFFQNWRYFDLLVRIATPVTSVTGSQWRSPPPHTKKQRQLPLLYRISSQFSLFSRGHIPPRKHSWLAISA